MMAERVEGWKLIVGIIDVVGRSCRGRKGSIITIRGGCDEADLSCQQQYCKIPSDRSKPIFRVLMCAEGDML
jgi:hypothetical protein